MPSRDLLSKTECSALRGIAILGIVLHNYCHWLGFAVKENEYKFSLSRSESLWTALCNPDQMLPIHLLSYFGHYGVPLFLFLSGYGLVLKYEKATCPDLADKPLPFIYKHFSKLFRIMIPGLVVFVLIDQITPGSWHYKLPNVLAQLLMIINIFPDPDHIIWPGPYWFFGLMLQIYIVYRLFVYRRNWPVCLILIIICWGLQAMCHPESETLNRLRYNCIGGMVPFIFGVLAARYPIHLGKWTKSPRWFSRIISVFCPNHLGVFLLLSCCFLSVLSVVMCFGYQAWLWIPIIIVAASVALIKCLPEKLVSCLSWLGVISASMFVCHPILRKILIPISRSGDVYSGLLLYIISVIAVAIIWRKATRFI